MFNERSNWPVLSYQLKLFILHPNKIYTSTDTQHSCKLSYDENHREHMKRINCHRSLQLVFKVFVIIFFLASVWQVLPEESFSGFDWAGTLNDTDTDAFLSNHDFEVTRKVKPSDIACILIQMNIQCILKQNFYIHTYPLNKKSIIDIPAFFPYKEYQRDHTIGITPFYYETDRMFFTEECDGIASYVALCDPMLLQRLYECVDVIKEAYSAFNLDPRQILPLFRNFTVQDRQVGVMFHADKQYKRCHFHAHVPLIYLERNYFATEQEREKIEKAFALALPASEDSSTKKPGCHANIDQAAQEFQYNHLVSDKLGIGDLRLHLDFIVAKGVDYSYGFGLVGTIPTAFAFEKGLLGGCHDNCFNPKDFSISNLWNMADEGDLQGAATLGQQFFLGALDELSLNLLDAKLGYGNHMGIGASFFSKGKLSFLIKRPWAKRIKMRSRMILQYYTPATELRSFVEKKNPDDYFFSEADQDKVRNDATYAQDVLDVFTTKFIQEFYPFRFNTMVNPGFLFQSTSTYYFEYQRWKLGITTDFWARQQESFGDICMPRKTPPLEIECAKRPGAYQSRIGASATYTVKRPRAQWSFSLYGDTAYWSEGIGKDFTLCFNIECNF